MKKHLRRSLMLLVVTAMAWEAQAQYSDLYYHRVGDTIMYDSPIYYHNWWGFEQSYQTQERRIRLESGANPRKLLSYSFTATPLEVIGIAALKPILHTNPITGVQWDSAPQQEYFLLYEATPDSVYKVAEIPWYKDDPHRSIFIRGNGGINEGTAFDSVCCGSGTRWYEIHPIVEYYFDTPIILHDSFYVGQTFNSYLDITDPAIDLGWASLCNTSVGYYAAGPVGGYINCEEQASTIHDINNEVCGLYWPSIIYSLPGTALYDEHPSPWYTNYRWVPMVFPIIRVDTTVPPPDYCPPVENLQVQTAGDSCVDVTWDAFINHQFGYEVQYGPRSMPESQWESAYPDINFAHLCDLNPDFLYGLRVRPYCNADKQEGEWSEVVYFRPTVGAATEPSALSQHTTLAPNPATESVRVESDYVIMKVDVYDAVGQHVWNIPVYGRRTEIDLGGLTAGGYHLLITTSQGVTVKRLVVAR